MDYEYLEDEATADLAIRAYGNNLKKAFENTAKALINAIAETGSVEEQEIKLVAKSSENIQALLYDFLGEIIYLHDSEGIVFRTVRVEELDEKNNAVSAVLKGEKYDKNKHKPVYEVKAITYFGMKIEKTVKGYEINVTVDL